MFAHTNAKDLEVLGDGGQGGVDFTNKCEKCWMYLDASF